MSSRRAKLYLEQKNTLNHIGRELNLDKMYLYRYVGNYKKIKTMPYEIVLGIAKVEEIEADKLYNRMLGYALENSKGGK